MMTIKGHQSLSSWYYLGIILVDDHYENMPIQIYWKVNPEKLKIFRQKNQLFSIFLLKT